jgi:hypothetical protein
MAMGFGEADEEFKMARRSFGCRFAQRENTRDVMSSNE